MEIAVVIVVLSLLLAMIAGIATAMVGMQRREATRQRLAGVETALALFVSQNKRLPCPADGRQLPGAAQAGTEWAAPTATCWRDLANANPDSWCRTLVDARTLRAGRHRRLGQSTHLPRRS
ncbi:MAG: hypothetical protein IPJ28_04180 [Betaproteobacteria bacterium]|nr:hypothetical protein [Betaproteobacteria bacterium]